MRHYDDYLAQLPLNTIYDGNQPFVSGVIEKHPLFLAFNSDGSIAYFKIDETDACAVVIRGSYRYSKLVKEFGAYTLRVVYLLNSNKSVIIPDTVWSLYGSENWPVDSPPFRFEEENPYFNFVENDEEKKSIWLYSTDGEDLIFGLSYSNWDSRLEGVKTIHHVRQLHQAVNRKAMFPLSIPASVKEIKKLEGLFTEVTFQGALPKFAETAFDNAKFDLIKVLTTFDIDQIGSVLRIKRSVSEDKLLFVTHELTDARPKSKGYIALTNAHLEDDGHPLFVNTSWIATISPRAFMRSDGVVNGSVVLIGLKEGRQENGVAYDVYESPEIIDEKIAAVQSEPSQQLP